MGASGGYRSARGERARECRGAVAVEFALVLPLLVMLLLGIVTFGLAFNERLALTNGVREGGRFGASLPSHDGWEAEVVSRTREVLFSSGSQDGLVICAELTDSSGADVYPVSTCSLSGKPSSPSGLETGDCIVKVWATRPATLNILLAQWTVDLRAQSVSYYERTPCGPIPPPPTESPSASTSPTPSS